LTRHVISLEAQWLKEQLRRPDTRFNRSYVDSLTRTALGCDPIREHIIIKAFKHIYDVFSQVASEGARIVVTEHLAKTIPDNEKQLRPLNVKGKAGGLKFSYKGVFFKLAVDNEGLYGGDEFAMKVPIHERKSYVSIARMSDMLWSPWSFNAQNQYIRKQGNAYNYDNDLFLLLIFYVQVCSSHW